MSITRVILCSCTYDENVLCITDMSNEELQEICEIVSTNNENGIGKTWADVAHEIDPDCLFEQLISNGEAKYIEPLRDLASDTLCIASKDDLAIGIINVMPFA